MHHHIATPRSGLLFESWEEAHALWRRLTRAFPNAHALCLLPDRVLVITPRPAGQALSRALMGHTRSLERPDAPRIQCGVRSEALSALSLREATLALYAAPCRRGLVLDPMAWIWSSYREALGLVPGTRPDADPENLHHDTCRAARMAATPLPAAASLPRLLWVRAAVSAATRTPLRRMHRPGPARTLWIAAARALCGSSDAELARHTGAGPIALSQATASPAAIAQVAALAGDPRFPGLASGLGGWLQGRRAA